MSTSRRTRKQMVGKVENAEAAQRLKELAMLTRLVHREWWSQQLGQIDASQVLDVQPTAHSEYQYARSA
jgi:hypothetical protein